LQLVRCCGSAMLLLDARVVLVLSHLGRYSTRSVKRVTDDLTERLADEGCGNRFARADRRLDLVTRNEVRV
jgi:hypothetical protein